MENKYEIRGNVVAIITTNKKLGEIEILTSLSDLPKLIEFNGKWSICGNTKKPYVRSRPRKGFYSENYIYLHRWLTGCPKGMVVDHVNGNTLDNTRENMRIVTQSENTQNRRGPTLISTTGIRGVFWDKKGKKWKVLIQVNKKSLHIGYFENIHDAEIAAKEARSKYMTHSLN